MELDEEVIKEETMRIIQRGVVLVQELYIQASNVSKRIQGVYLEKGGKHELVFIFIFIKNGEKIVRTYHIQIYPIILDFGGYECENTR